MPAQVKILVEGYSNAGSVAEIKLEKTRPTITLVRDGNIIMVVDPGTLESQQILIDALAEERLRVEDVNYVYITHSHIDHYRNIGMFPNAKTLEFYGVWDKEVVEPWSQDFSSNIKVVATPGHDSTSISLFVTTHDGVVAICGDVFWQEDYPKDPYDDIYADNYDKLIESRDMIFKMSDWIIPGHGKMFKVKPSHTHEEEKPISLLGRKEAKESGRCRKCSRVLNNKDRCLCRSWLCFRCCECDMDCDLCACGHKRRLTL